MEKTEEFMGEKKGESCEEMNYTLVRQCPGKNPFKWFMTTKLLEKLGHRLQKSDVFD